MQGRPTSPPVFHQPGCARSSAETRSAAITTTKVAISRSDTGWHRREQLESDAARASKAKYQRRADVLVEPVACDPEE